MGETNTQPKPWRCLHCDERVDPTMSLCWNCGHDREGVAQPAMFVDVAPTTITACTRCRYDLHGNPEAERCPECGEPVPWADCPSCGARATRGLMEDGCPACRAVAAGVAFIPEVEMKTHTHCPNCRYELRGLPDGSDCPECGRVVAQGVYDTVVVPRKAGRSVPTPSYRTVLTVCLLLLTFPTGIIVFALATLWIEAGEPIAGLLLIAMWVTAMGGCIILAHKAPVTKPRRDDAERRSP